MEDSLLDNQNPNDGKNKSGDHIISNEKDILYDHIIPNEKDSNNIEKKIRKWGYTNKDPILNANIFSKLFFYWAFKIIKLANLMPLKHEYFGKLESSNMSNKFSKNMSDIWHLKKYKNLKSAALLKAVLRANIGMFILMILLSIFVASFEFSSVYLFRIYIKMFQKDYMPPYEFFTKLNIGIAFLVLKIFSTFIARQSNLIQTKVGYKASIELNRLIFEKVLKASPASFSEKSSEGEIINFLQVDSMKLSMVMTYSPALFSIPILIAVYTYMLFEFMGISFLYGFGILFLFLIINFIIQLRMRTLQKNMLKKRDSRMKVTTETFNGLKILKLYAWEEEFMRRIEKSRKEELKVLKSMFCFSTLSITMLWYAPMAVSIASIGAYQFYVDELRIEDMFTCIAIFNNIGEPIRTLPWILSSLFELIVSMRRIQKFLSQEEIDTSRITEGDNLTMTNGISLKIKNGNFSWGVDLSQDEIKKNNRLKSLDNCITSNKNLAIDKDNNPKVNSRVSEFSKNNINRNTSNNNTVDDLRISVVDPIFESSPILETNADAVDQITNPIPIIEPLPGNARMILKNIDFDIKQGEFICIIGEVGSGKSSLLQALLNNMLPIKNQQNAENPLIIVNGSISYVSQIPWIQNDTVRNNVIFNHPYDEKKYNYVIDICELRPDLSVLVGGDMTEIGEKGINLSGGQKARINLARALYADKDIFLLDDPISALDANVGQNVMKNCIVEHLKNRTRILVTHALQFLSYADRIFYMHEGRIKWQGTYKEIFIQDFYRDLSVKLKRSFSENTNVSNPNVAETNAKGDNNPSKGVTRITKSEDKEEGKVKMEVFYTYIRYMGGFCCFLFVMICMCSWQTLKGGSDLWLSHWTINQSKENNMYYFEIYAGLGTASAFFVFIRALTVALSSLKCSKRLHEEMINKLVNAPINLYHDTVPKGQILNRLSKDLVTIDTWTNYIYGNIFVCLFAFLGCIVFCSLMEPYSLFFLPILFILGWVISRFYVQASRDLGRIEGIMRSPILNLLAETIPGSMTIRAYKIENIYLQKFFDRADEHNKVRIVTIGVSQWFGLVLDLHSIFFLSFLIAFTVFFEDHYTSQKISILLTYSLSLQSNLFNLLSSLTTFENSMVSMERCLKYTQIATEADLVLPTDIELFEWPSKGEIKFENYSVKYRPDTELVLKNLNFTIKAGEKIGVVGRTGSGKSTLCLSLFRILEPTTGNIYIDDVNISLIGLKKLRSSLTIIPQDPNLMEGTLKYNIDPLELYSEDAIKNVMSMIGFWYICENNSKGLEQIITESGNNLSVGEKQLICITRAILRNSRIIVMDEATANIDIRTEEIIQQATNVLLKSSTVITIAHRIKTIINYDKILVLNYGEMVEYDSPQELLENKNSIFYQLCKNSNI